MQEWITVTIDGQTVSVPPGTVILEAARSIGIEIPSLCYYAKLSKLGACRLCLVEVERMRGLQTACTTVVRPEMVVRTNTPEIIKARRGVLEFLLTNHPLDCPVCDKGGECELQDLAFGYGPGESRYVEERRHKRKAVPLGPTIIMDEERCVLCRRCVRYLKEWADEPALDYMKRGCQTYVGTFEDTPLKGKFVGNVVDICPVGALTSRTSRFAARAWEYENTPSVCVQCGVGCNVTLGVKTDTLHRVTARLNPAVNDEWLCDRGRFAIDFVHGKNRLISPLVRGEDGELAPASWEDALSLVGRKLTAIVEEHGPDALGGLGSAVATNEANYLLQRFMRAGFGTNNIDHIGRLPESAMPVDMERLAGVDVVVLCNVELNEEAPVIELLFRHRATEQEVKFIGIGPVRPDLTKTGGTWLSCVPGDLVAVLNGLASLLLKTAAGKKANNAADLAEWVKPFTPQETERLTGVQIEVLEAVVGLLANSKRPVILYGSQACTSSDALRGLNNLALLVGAGVPACVASDCNSRGALDMGVVPGLLPGREPLAKGTVRERLGESWKAKLSSRPGLSADEMKAAVRDGRMKALYIMHANPVADAPGWEKTLKGAGAFIVVQDMFLTETAQLADVVLPCASFAEGDGTVTNLAGRVQRVRQCVPLLSDVRTDAQILRALAREMGGDFGYDSVQAVTREIARVVELYAGTNHDALPAEGRLLDYPNGALRFARAEYTAPRANDEYPLALVTGRLLYNGDWTLRETDAFVELVPEPFVLLNPADAAGLDVKDGHKVKVSSRVGQVRVVVHLSEDVRRGCAYLPVRVNDTLAVTVLQDDVPVTHVRISR